MTPPPPRPPIIAREGWPIIAGIALVAAIIAGAGFWLWAPAGLVLGAAGLVVTAWALWFFRDPERDVPQEPGLVICPADGVVSFIGPGSPPSDLALDQSQNPPGPMTRVSVFMNIFNVHVNRSPVAGHVEKIAYRSGKFFNASLDKASEHNERCSLALALPDGRRMAVVQVAGLIARRIVCRAREGQSLAPGERFGMIRFGSRVDVYMPPGATALVRIGEAVRGGETALARLPAAAPAPPVSARPQASGKIQEV